MSLRHLATTIFDAGQLKPKYLFKNDSSRKNPEYLFKTNIPFFKNPEYSFKANIKFLKNQKTHSKKLFILLKSPIFVQRKYSFF